MGWDEANGNEEEGAIMWAMYVRHANAFVFGKLQSIIQVAALFLSKDRHSWHRPNHYSCQLDVNPFICELRVLVVLSFLHISEKENGIGTLHVCCVCLFVDA